VGLSEIPWLESPLHFMAAAWCIAGAGARPAWGAYAVTATGGTQALWQRRRPRRPSQLEEQRREAAEAAEATTATEEAEDVD
jgi:hypothetical protein